MDFLQSNNVCILCSKSIDNAYRIESFSIVKCVPKWKTLRIHFENTKTTQNKCSKPKWNVYSIHIFRAFSHSIPPSLSHVCFMKNVFLSYKQRNCLVIEYHASFLKYWTRNEKSNEFEKYRKINYNVCMLKSQRKAQFRMFTISLYSLFIHFVSTLRVLGTEAYTLFAMFFASGEGVLEKGK